MPIVLMPNHSRAVVGFAPGSVSGMGLAFGTREGRQEHACQNGDDGNDHQEFDQGEGLGPLGG